MRFSAQAPTHGRGGGVSPAPVSSPACGGLVAPTRRAERAGGGASVSRFPIDGGCVGSACGPAPWRPRLREPRVTALFEVLGEDVRGQRASKRKHLLQSVAHEHPPSPSGLPGAARGPSSES